MTEEELELIRLARTDSVAFERLFRQYLPLVGNTVRQFYLIGFEQEDWLQEARIALLKTVGRYDGSRGSKFGPYYRLVLRSHYRSLLRRQMAKKRHIDSTATLVADPHAEYATYPLTHDERERELIFLATADRFFATLSPLELLALQVNLLGRPEAQQPRMRRALERAKEKYLRYLALQ
ncbi:sigma-70 family RNA polymerase sigma factor [Lacticaseibacillus absianus]|uniref:sigma-70 family RNA polymerase sigma factor n=1 Tax=Lacticaseibacillus absianus TaxID=2729623 RepID=UPI0015CEDE01|nr:sigma-70 family RNA polymerase sigma factor [Lacticaseibacillus absianus]